MCLLDLGPWIDLTSQGQPCDGRALANKMITHLVDVRADLAVAVCTGDMTESLVLEPETIIMLSTSPSREN